MVMSYEDGETLPPKGDREVFSPRDPAWEGGSGSPIGAQEEPAKEDVGKGIPGRGSSLPGFISHLPPSVL